MVGSSRAPASSRNHNRGQQTLWLGFRVIGLGFGVMVTVIRVRARIIRVRVMG